MFLQTVFLFYFPKHLFEKGIMESATWPSIFYFTESNCLLFFGRNCFGNEKRLKLFLGSMLQGSEQPGVNTRPHQA